MISVRRWLIRPARRTLRRLEWFPFTLLSALLFAAVRLRELRTGRAVVRVGRATGGTAALPLRLMLWLDHIGAELPSGSFDVCVRLPRAAEDANLHDVISVLLTSPRLASIGLYWDDDALSDDQPLWQNGAAAASGANDIDEASAEGIERFLRAEHQPFALPVAARREVQTLLKRLAGGAYAICLNLPAGQMALLDVVVTAAPGVRFFEMGCAGSKPRPANITALADYGLTLHERMAFVQAADAYVGIFDELGGAAIISGRPGVLVGRGDPVSEALAVTQWAAEFLGRRQ